MTGRLGAYELRADLTQSIYVCDTDQYSVVTVNICNRGTTSTNITIAITDSESIIDNATIIEMEALVAPNDVLERNGIVVHAGSYITVLSSQANVSAVVYGAAVGEEIETTPITTFTQLVLQHTLDDPNPFDTGDDLDFGQRDEFGYAVAVSGDRAIVGAWKEDVSAPLDDDLGRAYIYNATTGALLHTLQEDPGGEGNLDYFGQSVAISGNLAIVGAYFESGGGKAYIFNVTDGSLVHTLDNPNDYGASSQDAFGFSVAISGDRAIVGAPYEDDAGGDFSGKAYIFDATTGALVHTLDSPNAFDTIAGDEFGNSVAISGDRAIVAAWGEDDASGTGSGKAYIFDVTTGALVHTLDNPNDDNGIGETNDDGDRFGWAVAISGNHAIVSAFREDEPDTSLRNNSGKAYIYDVTSGNLLHTLDNPNAYSTGEGDNFGASVAISGNYAIVGAELEDDAGGTDSGKAYIFNVTSGNLLHTLDNPNAYNTSADDRFGHAVAIDGTGVIVGAYLEDDADGSNNGKAYIYSL